MKKKYIGKKIATKISYIVRPWRLYTGTIVDEKYFKSFNRTLHKIKWDEKGRKNDYQPIEELIFLDEIEKLGWGKK